MVHHVRIYIELPTRHKFTRLVSKKFYFRSAAKFPLIKVHLRSLCNCLARPDYNLTLFIMRKPTPLWHFHGKGEELWMNIQTANGTWEQRASWKVFLEGNTVNLAMEKRNLQEFQKSVARSGTDLKPRWRSWERSRYKGDVPTNKNFSQLLRRIHRQKPDKSVLRGLHVKDWQPLLCAAPVTKRRGKVNRILQLACTTLPHESIHRQHWQFIYRTGKQFIEF